MPGDVRQPFAHGAEARQILTDAEAELQSWQPQVDPVSTNAAGLGANLMPTEEASTTTATSEAGGAHGMSESELQAATAPASQVPKEKETGEGNHLQAAIAS